MAQNWLSTDSHTIESRQLCEPLLFRLESKRFALNSIWKREKGNNERNSIIEIYFWTELTSDGKS